MLLLSDFVPKSDKRVASTEISIWQQAKGGNSEPGEKTDKGLPCDRNQTNVEEGSSASYTSSHPHKVHSTTRSTRSPKRDILFSHAYKLACMPRLAHRNPSLNTPEVRGNHNDRATIVSPNPRRIFSRAVRLELYCCQPSSLISWRPLNVNIRGSLLVLNIRDSCPAFRSCECKIGHRISSAQCSNATPVCRTIGDTRLAASTNRHM